MPEGRARCALSYDLLRHERPVYQKDLPGLDTHLSINTNAWFSSRFVSCIAVADLVSISQALRMLRSNRTDRCWHDAPQISIGSVVAFFHHVVLSDRVDDLVGDLRDVRARYLVARFLQ